MSRYLLMFLLPLLAFGQFSVSGEVSPAAMIRLDGGELINLPFRAATVDLVYSVGDFDLRTSVDLEARWQNKPDGTTELGQLAFASDQAEVTFPEAYLTWYPAFGEVSLGNMIHAWGAADANNPTDNLSPYDFYFMFLAGTDRKAASPGLSSKIYFGDFNLDLVIQPWHVANRLPHAEPDFPIDIPAAPDEDSFTEMDNELEFAGRLQYAFGAGDISASYFQGHDRMFNLLAWYADPSAGFGLPAMTYGYRETNVLGLDAVLFPGNWAIRAELGFFSTSNPFQAPDPSPGWFVFEAEADYLQYVFQAEYLLANEMQLMAQLIGTEYQGAEGFGLSISDMGVPSVISLNEDNFQAGMGTPFAMISSRIAAFSTMATLFDSALELTAMLMLNIEELEDYDLNESGFMTNLGASYTIVDGLYLDARAIYFYGDGDNQFSKMKDFSHLNLGLSYKF